MAKVYDYWHLITEVNLDYQKNNPEIKVGLACTHRHKWNNWVTIMNIKTGKRWSAYKLKYLRRIRKDLPDKETHKLIQESVKELQQ